MIPVELRLQLIETILKVPATDSYSGRTTLLNGIQHKGLNRNEGNRQQDFELLVEQLMPLRRDEDNKCCLLILIDNAIGHVSGMTLANDLQALRERLHEILEATQIREKQLLRRKHDTILMNGEEQVKLFRQVVNGDRSERVLLIQGAAKMGKSHLMREFRRISREERQMPCALVDITARGQDYRDALNLIVQEVGYRHFQRYEQKASQQSSTSPTQAANLGDMAAMAALLMTAQRPDMLSASSQRNQLTQAFIEDLCLMSQTQQVVLLLDAFEKGSEETKRWIFRELLIGLYKLPNVLTVIAGRELLAPELTWQDLSITTELKPVTVEQYRAFRDRIGASELKSETIPDFHRGFGGNPGRFAEVVENFIPAGGVA